MIIGSNILSHENLSSTNIEASRLLSLGEPPEGTVITTGFQNAGKGQAGNRWESERDKNLLFSVILYPQSIDPGDQFLISMSISLGICTFLDRYITGIRIKWPNDIYYNNDKIAGILIENSITGSLIGNCIAGIGLNINQEKFEGISPAPVSLKMITGKDHDLSLLLRELLSELDKKYKFLLYGDPGIIKEEYLSRLFRFGEWCQYRSSGSVFSGRIVDVNISGHLVMEMRDGSPRSFSFKEFSYLL